MGWLSKISTVNILGSQKIEPMTLVDVNGCISQQLAHPEEILWLTGKMDGYSLPFHFIPIYTKGHPFTTSIKNDQFRARYDAMIQLTFLIISIQLFQNSKDFCAIYLQI